MDELAFYLIEHYRHLLTAEERELHLGLGIFMVNGHHGPDPVSLASVSENPKVRERTALGKEAFHRDLIERILHEHGNEVVVTRCPKCDGLCPYPDSTRCRRCRHNWKPAGR